MSLAASYVNRPEMDLQAEPDRVRTGDIVTLSIGGADAQIWISGLSAELERQSPDGWAPFLHLTGIPVGRSSAFPLAIPSMDPRYERAVGVLGPIRFQIPEVSPGNYRLSRLYVRPGPVKVTLHVDLQVIESPPE